MHVELFLSDHFNTINKKKELMIILNKFLKQNEIHIFFLKNATLIEEIMIVHKFNED